MYNNLQNKNEKMSKKNNNSLIFQNTFDALIITDEKGTVRKMNEIAKKTLKPDFKPDEKFNISQFLKHENDSSLIKNAIKEAMNNNLWKGELHFVTVDNSNMVLKTKLLKINDESMPGDFLWIQKNITEPRKTELLLKENRAKYENIIERGSDGIVIIQNYKIKFVNSKMLEVLGYKKENVIEKNFLDFISPESKKYIENFYDARLNGETVTGRYSIKLLDKKNREIPVEINASIIEYQGKSADLAIVRDNRERYQSEKLKTALFQIAQSVTLSDNLEDLLRSIHQQLGTVLDTTNFYVALYNSSTATYTFPYFVDEKLNKMDYSDTQLKKSLTDYVRSTGKPLLINRKKYDKMVEEGIIDVIGTPALNWLLVPLRTAKGNIGMVGLKSYANPNLYSQEDLDFMTFVSGNIAMAIRRKTAEDALRESELKHRTLLNSIRFPVMSCNKKYDILYCNRAYGEFVGKEIEELQGKNLIQLFPDMENTKPFEIYKKTLESGEANTFEGEFNNKFWFIWVNKVKEGILVIANDITERKKAENKLHDSLDKLKKLSEQVIEAMALTVETRDLYTAGHQKRVAQLACKIAEEMKLEDNRIRGLRMAAVIHDIGKIYVPAEILSKPSKLSNLEYDFIKEHPKVSYDILKTIEFPWNVAEIVLQHHERINGTGYPYGLISKEIMLEAKILAVADVVEAMTFHRPYRGSLGIEAALDEIQRNKGILYDPVVVDTCIRLFREQIFTFQ